MDSKQVCEHLKSIIAWAASTIGQSLESEVQKSTGEKSSVVCIKLLMTWIQIIKTNSQDMHLDTSLLEYTRQILSLGKQPSCYKLDNPIRTGSWGVRALYQSNEVLGSISSWFITFNMSM